MTPARRVDPRVHVLADMLTYCRPMGSDSETAFKRRYLWTLPGCAQDRHGNVHVTIACPDGTPSAVVWSSHTDTVHRAAGRQRVRLSRRARTLTLPAGSKSSCLGADDTVGVWLMCEMIRALVPGHYVFHYGEERGGVGSRAVVRNSPEYFSAATSIIALDRGGCEDVITHQAGERCCSDDFARSLAAMLPAGYVPCQTGAYTDSAEYVDTIGECTNLSVGYGRQHSEAEHVDVPHALALCDALFNFDEAALVLVRQPGDPDPDDRFDWLDRWHARDFDRDYGIDPRTGALVDDRASRPVWDYGAFESSTLTEDDRAELRRLGWARTITEALGKRRKRWAFY